MDPYDVVDYTVDVTNLLETGETVASYTISPTAEAALLGLALGINEYGSTISNNVIRIWISTTKPNDTAFDGTGVTLPIELTVMTNAQPPRKKQRTLGVKVAQR
ncbi:MAG: hypothetical protein EOO61_00780 [Hymenobacter sp.]|nr:MAG: hypothetical protein EOO61_00780 [Hymenobacter sp.]